jgi:hypothetical protein
MFHIPAHKNVEHPAAQALASMLPERDCSTANFTIKVDQAEGHGHFEHKQRGDECGGGLWFNGNELTDFDGAMALPGEVGHALRDAGFIVGPDFL